MTIIVCSWFLAAVALVAAALMPNSMATKRFRLALRFTRGAFGPIVILPIVLGIGTVQAAETDFSRFPRYTEGNPVVPVYVVSADRTLHRFFDTSPISPSGRYLALFRMPYEGRSPSPGDAGEVVLVDLQSGQKRVAATSRGWEVQVGANVQWGRSDEELYFNDVDLRTWKPFAVCMNPATGAQRRLDGTVFMVSCDGATLASHNLVKSRLAQVGYGVAIPDQLVSRNLGPVADDGIYLTDAHSGRSRMLVSLKTIYETAAPSIRIKNPEMYEYYGFQVKWNPQGTRLLTTVQWTAQGETKKRRAVITMNADGTNIRTAITAEQWARGGHHINWCPDGDHLSMNLNVDSDRDLEIITVNFDGSDLRTVFKPGSGHPSFHHRGRYLITDAYPYEPIAFGDGTVPLRLIDVQAGACTNLMRVFVSATKGEFRVDPHPAWDRSGRYVVFNGYIGDTRRVYVADLAGLLK